MLLLSGYERTVSGIVTIRRQRSVILLRVSSPASDPGHTTAPDYYIDVNGEGFWDVTSLNTVDETLRNTV